ncbi:hypothetical protein DACRYDRAFT_48589, partial [Dacryopinax primogenitus]
FDISINGQYVGRLVFRLREDVVPRTVQNFMQLCTAPAGTGYRGTAFHTVESDVSQTNSSGGRSIWGGHFPDENHQLLFTGRGNLAMNSTSPNQNGSQFFITLCRDPIRLAHINRRHVVFGSVVSGWPVLDTIEACGSATGGPNRAIVITNCGVL